ncbi:hypothetical protein KEHDKFFH_09415 [Marinobacter maroccanus]|uniref:Uncharacterized protein n=1 Tax=Marinobacter maroccanus TaxID=2055143 RepID=A0A2S5ZBA7_9GAMM|nr:hypothetical protein [Marinobacter maroccanus]PPI84482.1 hypothetical protein KEHDKFFH_09415 [Marinobacter maroccanus]
MDYRAIVLVISFLCAFVSRVSFAQEAVAELKGKDFQEVLTEEASVGGRVVAGVLSSNARAAQALSLFSSPARESEDVCVRVISRDGLYWSENTFRWPSGSNADTVRLQDLSKYDLSRYAETDLSVLGYEGDCSEAHSGPVLIAVRGDNPRLPDSLDIFVNSGRSDTFAVITSPDIAASTIACHLIRKGRRTGYDTICTVPIANTGTGSLAIRIMRRRFDRMMPPTDLVVRLPERMGR